MFMHALGGFWIGLLYFYIFSSNYSLNLIIKILSIILCVGVGWEIFEFFTNNMLAQNPFNFLDTASDICFDLVGGGVAVLYYFKRIMKSPPLAPPPQGGEESRTLSS